ncbi:MAG TPA: tetratricopeptide repeat protein [Candidatus Limnocylindrales bacterium]|nr:tetratricopeptide repeat protein [Candidatus Limnocylindrales bacterium]
MDEASARSLLQQTEETSARVIGPDGKDALASMEARLPESLEAIDLFVAGAWIDEALRLVNALYRYWITSRRFDEGAATFARVLSAPGGSDVLRGRALMWAGFMPFWAGDDERAAALFDAALQTGRRIDDPFLISGSLGGLSRIALRSDVAEGRRLAREAYDVSTAAGDEAGLSNALHLLGVGAQIAGDLDEAREWMRQRLALVRRQGNELMVASEAGNLSMVERQLGNLDEAEALAHESLDISERIGDTFTPPFMLSGLASIALERGEAARAATLLGAAEAHMEATNMAWPPDERPHYEVLLERLPEAMGSATFEAARGEGRALDLASGIAFARSDRAPS